MTFEEKEQALLRPSLGLSHSPALVCCPPVCWFHIWAACSHRQFAIHTSASLGNGNRVLRVPFLLPEYEGKRKPISTGFPPGT